MSVILGHMFWEIIHDIKTWKEGKVGSRHQKIEIKSDYPVSTDPLNSCSISGAGTAGKSEAVVSILTVEVLH